MARLGTTLKTLATQMRLLLARLLLGPAANTDALALDCDARLAQTLRERERAAAATRAGKSGAPLHLQVISGGLDNANAKPGNPRPAAKPAAIAASDGDTHRSKAS